MSRCGSSIIALCRLCDADACAQVTGSAWDTDLVSASAQYLAINWQVAGGGAFGILPILSSFRGSVVEGFPNKLPDIIPLARGHSGPVSVVRAVT